MEAARRTKDAAESALRIVRTTTDPTILDQLVAVAGGYKEATLAWQEVARAAATGEPEAKRLQVVERAKQKTAEANTLTSSTNDVTLRIWVPLVATAAGRASRWSGSS